MKLEQQICSLELAKKLKALGVKQESIWWWHKVGNKAGLDLAWKGTQRTGPKLYSAFTVAELGEILPESFQCWKWIRERTLRQEGGEIVWNCLTSETTTDGQGTVMVASTEADARAKMLIYLLENKLLTL